MVTRYDVFYVIAQESQTTVTKIVEKLQKKPSEYRAIHNHVVDLEKEGYVAREQGVVRFCLTKKSQKLHALIHFCVRYGLSFNFLARDSTLTFLEQASKKEYFTAGDVDLGYTTFQKCMNTLSRYGFVLILSRKPWNGKLLEHHFLVDILAFFGRDATFSLIERRDASENIQKELRKLKKLGKIFGTQLNKIEEGAEVRFIHQSLSLEGNPITISDTQGILAGYSVSGYKITHVQEVLNYKQAVDRMLKETAEESIFDLKSILTYHGLAMHHIHRAGEFRKHDVRIKGNPHFKTTHWREVPLKVKELMQLYDDFEEEKKKDLQRIISFAAFFHNEFQRIHPFVDGNSRTSRLLMIHILRLHGIPVLDFPLGYVDQYMDLTKRSKHRNDLEFEYLLQELILLDLQRLSRAN